MTDESEDNLELQRTPETDRETMMKLDDVYDEDFWAFADTWKRIDVAQARAQLPLWSPTGTVDESSRIRLRTPPRLNLPPKNAKIEPGDLTPLPKPWRGDIGWWAAVAAAAILFYWMLRAF